MPPLGPAIPADGVADDAGATLPETADAVPVPEPNPRATPPAKTSADGQPSPRPARPVQGPPVPPAFEASRSDGTPPQTAPVPGPNPRAANENPDGTAPGEETAPADAEPEPMLPDPRSATRPDPSGDLPPEEIACRQRLHDLGVEFDNRPAESDPAGCAMPYPVVVNSLGKAIGLEPKAELNCATAEAAARFAKDVMAPAAEDVFGKALKSISHASAYVCRPRNGTRKLSEHAFGNALDITSFTLSDGTAIAVEPTPPERNGLFVARVRSAACGPFKTVLGPGSNADHAEHLHFDLAPRRNGGTVCE
ncbi:MAG: extensin family protein [Pseudomonadota bacterium]|nr:extensin family protein [Pseudomonadota bacterium]